MSTTKPRHLLQLEYEESAQAYLAMLRTEHPEHFTESTKQAKQRKITLESLDLVHARCPEVQVFNELLLQYPFGKPSKIRQVVPDNMVVVHDKEIKADGSFNLPVQPVGPFWMLEYVSKSNKRKDYEDNFRKYEHEVKVPYYLVFHPDEQELLLFRRSRGKYVSVKPNEHGRYPIPELEFEVAILDEWVRFWFRGELLPLPADLQRERDEARQQVGRLQRQLDEAQRELARLRAQLEPRDKN